ncbi:Down syndrome cell adhesion molecule-like protein 1 [Nymphon striatum]|nr:Down syndrome cell adhesion molecule-like protein 1 [Nymphon striatum]
MENVIAVFTSFANISLTVKLQLVTRNFVVKGSNQTFNQVSPDHSLEWLNGVGKKSGGIVGITKTNAALARWTLSYNQRASVSSQTYDMTNVGMDNQWTPNEATTARMSRDNHHEASIRMVLTRLKVMADEIVDRPDALLNIATRDVATADVEQSLLKAEQLRQNQLEAFVKDRMADKKVNFRDPLQNTKALTFASLYTVHVASNASKGKMETLKADRNFTQRLLMAYRVGRPVDLNNILNHELMKVPVSIADTSGTLRTGTKSILFDVLTKNVSCPTEITISESSCLIIDGQAMIMSLGKPADVNTFGEYADVVVKYVLKQGEAYNRIDVTFDRYNDLSIKGDTRVKRTKKSRPIRRLIEDDDVPLPNKWTDFMASTDNKGDLCLYLSNALATAPSEKTIVVGGGFASETEVRSTDANMYTDLLERTHEEADTRVVLHCIHSNEQTIVVTASDTDILILLLAHFNKLTCSQLWLKAGTSKKPKYVPIHDIRKQLGFSDQVYEIIPAFHAITGCDTVSYFSGHSKKSAWNVFIEHNDLLKDLGRSPTLSTAENDAE